MQTCMWLDCILRGRIVTKDRPVRSHERSHKTIDFGLAYSYCVITNALPTHYIYIINYKHAITTDTSSIQYISQLHFTQNKSFLLSQILHIFNILIKQYRPSTYTLIIRSQGISIWELIAKIQETPPLIQGNFVITCILSCLQKVTEGIKTMCGNTASGQNHFEKGNDQVLIQSLVCPRSIELEAKLEEVTKLFPIHKSCIQSR